MGLDKEGGAMTSLGHDTVRLPTPTCVICKELIPLHGDYFYGAHNACAKRAVDSFKGVNKNAK